MICGPAGAWCAPAALTATVTRCASVVGPAPFDAGGLDWYGGMPPGNVAEFSRAATGESALRPLVERLARDAVASAESGQLPIPDDYRLAAADRAALAARSGAPGYLARTRAAHADGVDGWIDDTIAFTRPWGFDVTQISAPVSIWYGPDDALCPARTPAGS